MSFRCRGFTVVELIMALSVMGILAVMVVPGFQNLIQDRRFVTASDNLAGAIALARSEAISRGREIFVSAVDGSNSANEWGPGYRVWFESDGTAGFSDDSELIHFQPELENGLSIDLKDDEGDNVTEISFAPRGLLRVAGEPPLELTVCDTDLTGETGKTLFVTLTGRIRFGTDSESTETCS